MKRTWMNIVYSSICGSYLVKSRPERTIDMMEKVLFLMHHESLKKHGTAFLEYPVYIDGDKIHVAYISDLLRIHQPVLIGYYRGHFAAYERLNKIYHKMLNRYRRYDEETLNKAVKKILDEEELDPRYFVYGKYESTRYLRAARFKINSESHLFLNVVRMFILWLPLPCTFIGSVYAQSIAAKYQMVIHFDCMKELYTISIICAILGIFWTVKWMNITAYERSKMIGEQYDY